MHKELNTAKGLILKYENNNCGNDLQNYLKFFRNNFISDISNIFYGIYNFINKCPNCNSVTNNFNYFNILYFPLDEILKFKSRKMNNNNLAIEVCFKYNENYDSISGQSFNYCNNCKKLVKFVYNKYISCCPKVLIINLKRDKEKNSNIKLNFGEEIDLHKFINPKKDFYKYKLIGIITQILEYDNVDIIAFVKSFVDNNWYKYDDINITSSSFKEASNTGIPEILFYSKINHN